jgi:nucleoside phosphorylase
VRAHSGIDRRRVSDRVTSPEFGQWLKEPNRNIKALEMEAVGVLRALGAHATATKALVVRGISDLADGNKIKLDGIGNGVFRRLAMMSAVELVWGTHAGREADPH